MASDAAFASRDIYICCDCNKEILDSHSDRRAKRSCSKCSREMAVRRPSGQVSGLDSAGRAPSLQLA